MGNEAHRPRRKWLRRPSRKWIIRAQRLWASPTSPLINSIAGRPLKNVICGHACGVAEGAACIASSCNGPPAVRRINQLLFAERASFALEYTGEVSYIFHAIRTRGRHPGSAFGCEA